MTLSAADFELLLQANRILSSKLDTGDVLQAVMELATKVVRAEASSLLLLDEAANELYIDVALGTVKDTVKQIRLKVGEGIAGWVAKERQPLIVNDVTRDSRFTGKVDKSTQFKTRSILAVPLLAKGRLIGVVEAINKEHSGVFSSEDQEAFEVFASQAAIALENARLFSQVTREKEKLNAVFAEMSDGVLLLDRDGKVLLLNPAGSAFLGLAPQEAVGRPGPELFKDFTSTPPMADLPAFRERLTSVELVRAEGKEFYLSARVLKAAEGFLVMLRDATEERRGEKLKRNFLSLISHKLKTPLTVIVGYAPILKSRMENMSDVQKKAVSAICDQGEHLSSLVDKLLRYTIVESDSLARDPESQKLESIVQKAVEGVAWLTEGTPVSIDVDPSVGRAPAVVIDATLTTEAVKNLLENAIKFNDKFDKKVAITAEADKGAVTLHVQDNGAGIPAEEREKVFLKFYQIENSFTGQIPGAGLGLTLVKKVVEALNGRVQLQSELGKGTRVSMTLPTTKTKKKKAAA